MTLSGSYWRISAALCVLAMLAVPSATAQTITAPSGAVSVHVADDFALRVLQDRWDMNQRSDLGWFLNSVDSPGPSLTGIGFSNGLFSATSSGSGSNVYLLETGFPGAAPLGKSGLVFPIDANVYRRLTFRMCLGAPPGGAQAVGQLLWSRQTLYDDFSQPDWFFVYPGCHIYSLDLGAWSQPMPSRSAPYKQYPWSGTMRMLRLSPTHLSGQSIAIDWASLAAVSDAQSFATIAWTGAAGGVDIYLDTDRVESNGTLGLLWKDNASATGVQGGSYRFQVGALPPGTYYVAMRPTGTTGALTYSTGYYSVGSAPEISMLSPSEDGSADDFATVQLGNPWDMRDARDVDRTINVTGGSFTTRTVEAPDGTTFSAHNVFYGAGTKGKADPVVELLWAGGRGRSHRIDTSRYRILSAEVGIAGARDINGGSIARIVWKRADESLANVSQDVVVSHRAGVSSLDKIVVDMADRAALPLETDAGGSPSHSGWTGQVDEFRIDPHEFSDGRAFWIGRVRLSAFERANQEYTLRWRLDGLIDPSLSVSLYHDANATGFNGTLIAANLPPSTETDGSGAFRWDLSSVTEGPRYVYLEVAAADGTVLNRAYARWPLVVDHSYVEPPLLALDRASLAFAATRNGAVITGAQEVAVSFTGGALAWTAASVTSGCPFLDVSPSSGTGPGLLSVSIERRTYSTGARYACQVRVDAPGAANTPQYVDVTFDVYGKTAPPFGVIDTPASDVAVAGAFGMTGWALDDVQVASVSIYRDKVAGESVSTPNGKVFVGNAAFLEDARPDLQAAYPGLPFAYRAGWGLMVLTNMLPFQGNGTFTFFVYANDVEGRQTLLGSRRVVGKNASSAAPFGAIDTPGQGQSVSGTVVNFGWVLTPQPNYIPADGSTIWVFVDGVPVGHPTYNSYREDIARLFPGYANTNGAIGYFVIDTTELTNGLHTIAWSVTDSAGHGAGIGSRFFRVRN